MHAPTVAKAKRMMRAKGHMRKSSWILLGDKASVGAMCIDCGLSVCVHKHGGITGAAINTACGKFYMEPGESEES